MSRPQSAVHRTILVVDVEGFGSPTRADPDRLVVREGLYRALRRALRACGIPWSRCHVEDRGDGILLLAPAQLPKAPFVMSLPGELAEAVRQQNARHRGPEQMRLRMALNAGEVNYDEHGVTAASVNLGFLRWRAIEGAFMRHSAMPARASACISPLTIAQGKRAPVTKRDIA
jgi:hypothetical protein